MKIRQFPIAVLYALLTAFAVYQADAQTLTAQQVQEAQLQDGFTLEYGVVERDVRTPQMKDNEIEAVRASYNGAVKRGRLSQNQADRVVQDLEKEAKATSPAKHFTVTVSARDNKLLFERQEGENKTTVIYDGEKTYRYETIPKRLYIRTGLRFSQMAEFPLPAMGLLHVPLAKSLSTVTSDARNVEKFSGTAPLLRASGARHGIVYLPAEFKALREDGKVKILSAFVMPKGVPIQKWEFLAHKPFRNLWLGTHMRWTRYDFTGNPQEVPKLTTTEMRDQMRPSTICDYKLQEASVDSLDAKRFDYNAYLKPQETVIEDDDGAETVGFLYEPARGNLDTQRSRQSDLDQAAQGFTASSSTKNNQAGRALFLLPGLLAIVGLCIWKRRQN